MNKDNSSTLGSFATLLTILFITLKLVGVINWSWLIVFSPLIVEILLKITLAFICLVKDKGENMIITKPCEWCGQLITFDSNKMHGDNSPIVYIKTRRGTKMLFCRECFNRIGASGAMCLADRE